MELRRFFNSIARMFWLVVLFGLIGGGIAFYTNYFATPVYEAETTIYAMTKGQNVNYQDVMLSRQMVQDYQEIITSDRVLALSADKLKNYNITPQQLKGMISVQPKNESSIISIRATSNEPKIAAEASSAVTHAFLDVSSDITNNQIVGVLDQAKIPQYPVSSGGTRNIVIGIIAGILAAITVIYIRELFDTTIRYAEDLERNLKIKVTGIIPKYGIR